jgi:hypothetical protein
MSKLYREKNNAEYEIAIELKCLLKNITYLKREFHR